MACGDCIYYHSSFCVIDYDAEDIIYKELDDSDIGFCGLHNIIIEGDIEKCTMFYEVGN